MKKSSTNVLLGIILVIVGISLAGKAFGLFNFTIYFRGWWTLFIIVPCFLGLFREGNKSGNLVGLIIGITLLLSGHNIFSWFIWKKLFIPVILVLIGLKIISRDSSYKHIENNSDRRDTKDSSSDSYSSSSSANYNNNTDYNNNYNNTDYNDTNYNNHTDYNNNYNNTDYNDTNYNNADYNDTNYNNTDYNNTDYNNMDYNQEDSWQSNNKETENNTSDYNQSGYNTSSGQNDSAYQSSVYNTNNSSFRTYTALLSGKNFYLENEIFEGADLTAIMGGIELNLRNAIIKNDVRIDVSAIMGGIDIYVPSNVKVVLNCNPILGGVDNSVRTPLEGNEATIFINGTCVLGGIDVK